MFPLCKTCADTLNQNPCTHTDEERAILGTWCHVELMKAIEKGYEVLEIHEVWHWEETTDELFKDSSNRLTLGEPSRAQSLVSGTVGSENFMLF